MKKLFAFISLFLLLGIGSAFADVTAKKLADGNVEVTFFYGNPRASEVLLAGDFNNWQNGAEAMTKTDKGFTITKTFKPTDELRYKFISDGNWTTDLKAPDFVDDGFGGKNGHVVIADLLGGDDDAGASKAKINFVSWSMFGVQAKFKTQGVKDPSKKGLDFDNLSLGFKSYNKFVGNFLPNCPIYLEIALAETPLDNEYSPISPSTYKSAPIYLAHRTATGAYDIEFKDGIRDFFSNILTNPFSYLGHAANNLGLGTEAAGALTSPYLGHLKFGFNTPYINYYTGYNYAKPDVRSAITWTTIASDWDAGYDHVGGFHVFSLGNKPSAFLQESTGLTFDVGFAPNKSADRRGYKYGYWGWADVSGEDWAVDFQTNGMYDSEYAFYDPVEHDFILGGKAKFGNISFALQGLLATHQKSTEDILKDNTNGGKYTSATNSLGNLYSGYNGALPSGISQYFGHSSDVFYRDTDFGAQNIAANVRVGYNDSLFGVNVEYRMRGAQASMLYVREQFDNGTFGLSDQLGVLNSQRIAFNGYINPIEALRIDLGVTAEMPLEKIKSDDETYVGYMTALDTNSWYGSRNFSENAPLFGVDGGAELKFMPAVSYQFSNGMSLGAYADMYVNMYDMEENAFGAAIIGDEYSASDSSFLLKYAGLSFSMKPDSNVVQGIEALLGIDNSNSARMFGTLTGQVTFPGNIRAQLGIGVKIVKNTDAGDAFKDGNYSGQYFGGSTVDNNPFAFSLGVAKQFQGFKKPTLYAQFVFNMDPYKDFGDGQDNLNMNRSNVKGIFDGQSMGNIDAVDFFDGKAALRMGVRWDI